jgi:hypothetical protein
MPCPCAPDPCNVCANAFPPAAEAAAARAENAANAREQAAAEAKAKADAAGESTSHSCMLLAMALLLKLLFWLQHSLSLLPIASTMFVLHCPAVQLLQGPQ